MDFAREAHDAHGAGEALVVIADANRVPVEAHQYAPVVVVRGRVKKNRWGGVGQDWNTARADLEAEGRRLRVFRV